MRNEFCKVMVKLAEQDSIAFLTGDLGFMALEPLQEVLGENFINAGVAEQNMVSVAAGLTLTGLQAWVYSIAPFCYARPFEQIRNDVCLNRLPVKLVGNGGGYAYGSMGGTHHALEDYGVLGGLIGMHIFVPAFSADIAPIVKKMSQLKSPSYLRLGKCELPTEISLPLYSPWRCLLEGQGPLVVCMGPLVGSLLHALSQLDFKMRPELWVVTEMPITIDTIPLAFRERLSCSSALCVVEEHIAQGGFGQTLLWVLAKNGIKIPHFHHAYAQGYLSGTYGSQQFHRAECGLDPTSIVEMVLES
jgi:transketolase